jgi:hypothetical protein
VRHTSPEANAGTIHVPAPAEPLLLDYAKPEPSAVRRLAQGTVVVAVVAIGALGGALLGVWLAPVTWTAYGMYEIPPVTGSLRNPGEVIDRVERDLALHADALQTPEALRVMSGQLVAQGHGVGSSNQELLGGGLDVRHVPNTWAVEVTFQSGDGVLSRDAVATALALAESRLIGGVTPRVFARPGGAVGSRSRLAPLAGAILGVIAAAVGLRVAAQKAWLDRLTE